MILGLTGSISSGKSTVSKLLASMGAMIVDADQIVHELQKKGQEGCKATTEAFGTEILDDKGNVDRKKLGAIVFSDKEKLQLLNRIMHPIVLKRFEEKTNKLQKENSTALIIWDVPLLIESGMHEKADKVLVVFVDENTQLQRLMARNGFTEEEAKARIQSAMSNQEKKKYADYLIDNSGTLEETEKQIKNILSQFNQK